MEFSDAQSMGLVDRYIAHSYRENTKMTAGFTIQIPKVANQVIEMDEEGKKILRKFHINGN